MDGKCSQTVRDRHLRRSSGRPSVQDIHQRVQKRACSIVKDSTHTPTEVVCTWAIWQEVQKCVMQDSKANGPFLFAGHQTDQQIEPTSPATTLIYHSLQEASVLPQVQTQILYYPYIYISDTVYLDIVHCTSSVYLVIVLFRLFLILMHFLYF